MMPKIICNGARNKGFGADAVTIGVQIGGKTMTRYADMDEVKQRCEYWDNESNFCALNKPSAQPGQKWIPVTERLPELGEKVLVSTKNTVFTQVFKCIYGTPDRWRWEHHTIKKVTAWMPLPEPYKEKKNDAEIR